MFPPMKLEGYAIYNPATGKWSKGGTGPKWGKNPKVWGSRGHLKTHLCQFVWCRYGEKKVLLSDAYKGCIVVDVTTGKELERFLIHDYLLEVAKRELSSKYKSDWALEDRMTQ